VAHPPPDPRKTLRYGAGVPHLRRRRGLRHGPTAGPRFAQRSHSARPTTFRSRQPAKPPPVLPSAPSRERQPLPARLSHRHPSGSAGIPRSRLRTPRSVVPCQLVSRRLVDRRSGNSSAGQRSPTGFDDGVRGRAQAAAERYLSLRVDLGARQGVFFFLAVLAAQESALLPDSTCLSREVPGRRGNESFGP
jgi:hypothetical protein